MAWVTVGNRKQCTIHDELGARLFSSTEQCPDCVRTPTKRREALLDEPPEPTPADCLAAVEHERRLTAIAILATDTAKDLCTGEDRNIPEAAKMFDVAIKAHRAAGDYTISRERKNYVARLERTVQRLRGGRN